MSTPQPPGTPTEPLAPPPVPEQKPPEEPPSNWQPVLYLKVGLLLFAIAYSIAFVVENTDEIPIDFVFATAKVHLIWEILLLLAVGLVGGVLLSQLYRHRRRAQLSKKGGKARNAGADVRGRDEAVGKSR